jgi:hypothetical protein
MRLTLWLGAAATGHPHSTPELHPLREELEQIRIVTEMSGERLALQVAHVQDHS